MLQIQLWKKHTSNLQKKKIMKSFCQFLQLGDRKSSEWNLGCPVLSAYCGILPLATLGVKPFILANTQEEGVDNNLQGKQNLYKAIVDTYLINILH